MFRPSPANFSSSRNAKDFARAARKRCHAARCGKSASASALRALAAVTGYLAFDQCAIHASDAGRFTGTKDVRRGRALPFHPL